MSKIFGIGLPKSGTSSLHEALRVLGFRARHNPDDRVTEDELRAGNYRLSILQTCDALTDTPIPAVFAQLDEAWPGSKFILTTRPLEAWLESSRRAGFNQWYATPKRGSTVDYYQALLFGCNGFVEARYRWVYETHTRRVLEHFAGAKAKQLLVMDIGQSPDWEPLCAFLGKPVPVTPFPHANPRSRRVRLTPAQERAVGLLVKTGVDYRWLRRIGRRLQRSRT